jgi:hypothetical protein
MHIADMLINNAFRTSSNYFLDDNVGYNQIFMAFCCPGIIGLFEWVVMTFGVKNADATYQRAMNLIFHDLLAIILEIYIDDAILKSDSMDSHLANLCLAFQRMNRCGLKMNPQKCSFGVSAGKFLGFIIHEHSIEISPKKMQSINKV